MFQLNFNRSNSLCTSKSINAYILILSVIVVLKGNLAHKHSEVNLYMSQDVKRLLKNGEISNIKDRLLESEVKKPDFGNITSDNYPYKVTEKMTYDLETADKDLKMAVKQAEKNEVKEREKKKIEGGDDDDGMTEPGFDMYGNKIKRDWNQPLIHEGNKCNLLLMKMFKLEGRLWSRKKDKMKICPGVSENCCTYMDELVVLKLWDEYSKPHVVEYVNKIIYNYTKILSLHYRIANISVREIDFHWYRSRTVTYERAICERKDEVAFLDFNKGVKGNVEELDIYYKKDDTEDKNFNVLEKVIDGSIAKDVKKEEKDKGKKKGKKGKKKRGKRELRTEDPLLSNVQEYHKWKGRILEEFRDSVRDTRKRAEKLKKMIDEHPLNQKSQVGGKSENQNQSVSAKNIEISKDDGKIEKLGKTEIDEEKNKKLVLDSPKKNETPEERGLSSEEKKGKSQTMNEPMKILMAGLKNSLDKIKENPEVKKIIRKTERMKELIKDEGMFKVTSNNAEESLEAARRAVKHEEREKMSKLKLTKKETVGIRNINWLKKNFQRALSEPVQRIHKIFIQKRRKLKEIHDKVAIRLAELHTRLEQKGLNKRDYERILKKFPKMSDFNMWVYDQIRNGKKHIEDMPEFIVYKEDKLNDFFKKTKITLEDMLVMEKEFLTRQKNVPIDNDFLYKFMKTLNKKDIPDVKLPFYPKRDRQLPELPKVPISKISCFSYPVSFPRKFLIFNPVKFEFCYKSVLKLRKFDAQIFSQYLSSVRSSIFQLVYLKKNIYCDLCDQPKQQFFDMENEMIYYKMGYCKTLISQFSEYIKWKNIIFIEYLNQVFNYIKCFETGAKHTLFPFKTYVAHQQRQIYFIRRCLQNLDEPDYFKYCHFMCKHFSYTGFDSFFIGDRHFLQNIFVLLMSFLRKMKVVVPRDVVKELIRGHGQFKISKVLNDYDYATYMQDEELNPFDDLNQRNSIPEHRKLRTSAVGLWGNRPKMSKPRPRKYQEIYDALEDRVKNAKLHPVHGIVFEEVGKTIKRMKGSENQNHNQNEESISKDNKRILQAKKLDPDDPDNDPDVLKDKKKYEQMKPTKEEEVKEIYTKIDTKLNPSNMKTLYIEKMGLDPFKTEGLSNFGYDIDELIPHHYSHIKLESLGTNTLHAVVPMGAREEYNFNKDIDLKFVIKKDKEVDQDLVDQLYRKREIQRNRRIREISKEERQNLENRLNPKHDFMDEIKKNQNDRYVESNGDKMAMPEIDILF